MKLLTNSNEIQKEFRRLMNTYSEYYWAVAWAWVSFEFFELLKENRNRIKKIVIGTSFDHTHPEFIREFIESEEVKFISRERELFHPKIYLFQDAGNNWEMLIGSMNFTKAGFFENTENLLLIKKGEDDNHTIYDNVMTFIRANWEKAKYFSEEEFEEYKIRWRNQERLSGKYGDQKGKPDISWHNFIGEVRDDKKRNFKERFKVLTGIKIFFGEKDHFNKLDEAKQIAIAGHLGKKAIQGYLGEEDIINWNLFGSTQPLVLFKINFIEKKDDISEALDEIPLSGEIKYEHYSSFMKKFGQIDFGARMFVPATRLLAMKRPDNFVCLNGKNENKLSEDFRISLYDKRKGDWDGFMQWYWDEIIRRIRKSDWWNTPEPTDEEELSIWKGRVAFLDSLYYED